MMSNLVIKLGLQGFWGSGENNFIFRELGSTGKIQGFGEQAHSFGDLWNPAKSKKKSQLKEKAFILFDCFKKSSRFWGEAPETPFGILNVFTFVLTRLSRLVLVTDMTNNFTNDENYP